MLFVDDDEREIGDRREDGGARADDDASFTATNAMPLLGTFVVGEGGVQDGDLVAEGVVQLRRSGGSESDLGDEHDRGPSGFKDSAHGGEIDGCLAGTGDAVQQADGKLLCQCCFSNFVEGFALRIGEARIENGGPRLQAGNVEIGLLLHDLDESASLERFDG